jgi:thymidylate synthase
MHCGLPRGTRKGERLAHFFDIFVSFSVPTVEEVYDCFDFSANDLEKYVSQILSPIRPEGVDYWYGERMQDWRGHNQLEEVVERLKKASDTKRATLAILEAPDLSTLEDAPCFTSATFTIADDYLHGSYVFRSHDMYEGWPFNVYAILRLHRKVAESLGCNLGRATFHSQNTQVYERHWDRALEKLHSFGPSLERSSELIKFNTDPSGNFVFTITAQKTIRCAYMNFKHDQILWETEHRDPSVIIAWIIESLPWLRPQHIRYLGVEEEKLRRALKYGEEYIQG